MSAMIKHLIDQRQRAWDQAKNLLDKVSDEQRDLNAEEQEQYKRMETDIDTFGARIKDLEEVEVRKADLEEQRKGFELAVRTDTPHKTRDEILSEKILGFVRGGLPGAEYAPRSVEFRLTHEDKLPYMDRNGGHSNFWETRDLTKGVTTAGGFTVPTGFVNRLYEHMVESSTVRQTGATIYTTDSGESLLVPKTTGHSTAVLVAEAAALTESDPAFGQATLEAYKYGVIIEVSNELLTDSGIDLLGYLARQCGRALGTASGQHFVTGTGVSQPDGVSVGVTTGKTGATGQTLTVIGDDLFDLYHSIVSSYRGRGVWLMRDSTLAFIRKIKELTTGGNQYLWQPGLTQGQPDSLLGRPVLTDPDMPAMAANAESILFGDFSEYYAIRDVSGVRFERSDDFRFQNDLVAFRALLRTDGTKLDLNAVKAYSNAAT